jgi:hypothetical protein
LVCLVCLARLFASLLALLGSLGLLVLLGLFGLFGTLVCWFACSDRLFGFAWFARFAIDVFDLLTSGFGNRMIFFDYPVLSYA